MNHSRTLVLVSACVLISLGSSVFSQPVSSGPTEKAMGEIDNKPIKLTLDVTKPGRTFAGIGGNFRLQSPAGDPPVIQYNLENLRVAWGRVAMPWNLWQPEENSDPMAAAQAGQVNPLVRQSMEMARKLAQRRIPFIISIWAPPAWALRDGGASGRGGRGGRGPLNQEKWDAISKSIGSYILYMKNTCGAEPVLFSFNESEMGVDVRQTAAEHCTQIKKLGAHFASLGVATKMLLGDTGNARGIKFIDVAAADPEAMKYVTAISFHSWRGGNDELLASWGQAARKLNLPLLVAEGGTDPQAYTKPQVLRTPEYSLDEITLYIRICALCQPESILQWQLTADYSLLTGVRAGRGAGGGENQPLGPTQRFWNLKQLGSTPAGAFYLPIACEGAAVACAAMGDIANGVYAVHLVNNGATRPASLTGLPASLKELRVYVTDSQRGMKEGARLAITDGAVQFTLDAASYTTLIGGR